MKWKSIALLALLGGMALPATGQTGRSDPPAGSSKRPLDLSAVGRWPEISGEQISSDGQWMMYTVAGGQAPDSLLVKSTGGRWELRLPAADGAAATCDGSDLIYWKDKTLQIYDIADRQWMMKVDSVESYKVPAGGRSGWVAWEDAGKQVVLYDVGGHTKRVYSNVEEYWWSANAEALILRQDSMLRCISVTGGKERNVPVPAGAVAGSLHFSSDGEKLYFAIRPAPTAADAVDNPDLHLWRYKDDYLPAERAAEQSFKKRRTYTCVLNLADHRIIQLDGEKDDPLFTLTNNKYVIIRTSINSFGGKWSPATIPSYYLKDLRTGEKRLLVTQRDIFVSLSPSEKYAIWYDPVQSTYFVHETATGVTRDLTPGFSVALHPAEQAIRLKGFMPFGIVGWRDHDNEVLLYDEFDIWKVNVQNSSAVNLTNGYGRRNKIILRTCDGALMDYDAPDIGQRDILLTGFDIQRKKNGFFRKDIEVKGDPVQLLFDDRLYYDHKRFNTQFMHSGDVIKAKNAEAWLLRAEDAGEYPNLYFTRDFRHLDPLSDLHPEKEYNWMSSELISWSVGDGKIAQGILYKPADFDPRKRYPVIFYFYELLSHRLHQFLNPEISSGSINIPWYVSNGYLVVTPDIRYHAEKAGEDALNTIVAAAHYLSGLSYVDSTKMGLQGHSFGGYEVNYIVSHCDMFAAAQESAGASDFISYYNGLYRGSSAQFYFEYGQGRVGGTLWEKPEAFIENSPIFHADKVQTPLLIMHNKDDGEVPFQQGVEWFTALRRLGKKVWMLQYEDESHSINRRANQMDFSIRTKQFFDHYLKGEKAPEWME